MWNFPNCLGALHGKHIIKAAPANSGSLHFNYKKTFSIVLLALVDANCKFIAVDIGSYGDNRDGGIFANSAFGKGLENGTINIPEDSPLPGTKILPPYVILGDEAFPLKQYLMRPYPGLKNAEDNEKRIFNYRLCRGRRLVECAFDILSQTFRIYQRRLIPNPENATLIVLTTCILHNIIRNTRTINNENVSTCTNTNCVQNLRRQGGNSQTEAFETREIKKKKIQFSDRCSAMASSAS
ncbi:uncharacterized protein LOC126741326 [Anthonomus grandis grandis]|uniref:uncharacterized protein LOC126741326 n=1 Tax=Anthonomus grandis grandis TaxID=2921223 RepID=UPI0021664929|nr:uncharacterized protein LOC126741326 [Anthonomus grandis grandis]